MQTLFRILTALTCIAGFPLFAGCVGQSPAVTVEFGDAPIWTVGVADAADGVAFGRIADVEVVPGRGILVLDEHNFALSWFGEDGQFMDRVGRNGHGPGEFAVPRGLHVGPGNAVHVLDARNARISRFELSGVGFRHVSDRRIRLLGQDLCLLDEVPMVNGYHGGQDIHVIDGDGQIIRSFGEQLLEIGEDARTSTWFDRTWLQNDGFLMCGHPKAPVIFAHRELPYVRAFDGGGRELWRTRLSEFYRVHWNAKDDGRRMAEAPDPESGTVTYTHGLAPGPGKTVLIGTYEYWYGVPVVYHTYVLSAGTGEELGRIESPFIAVGYDDGVMYGLEREPYPRISAYRVVFSLTTPLTPPATPGPGPRSSHAAPGPASPAPQPPGAAPPPRPPTTGSSGSGRRARPG